VTAVFLKLLGYLGSLYQDAVYCEDFKELYLQAMNLAKTESDAIVKEGKEWSFHC
jgi:hypothetical protein